MSEERKSLNVNDPWWGEHVHRYNSVLPCIEKQDRILDIACGTGFGSEILARHTQGEVIGGDISEETIKECNYYWNRANLSFKVLDGTQLKFPDNYFDVIVSFETIEHIVDYKKVINEFARVLKSKGIIVFSTPNSAITSPDGVIHNPFHTQEFSYSELKDLLEASFKIVDLRGQRYSRYDKLSTRYRLGKYFENLFLSFGIRKLPLAWRDNFMNFFFLYPLYPTDKDFVLETDVNKIKKGCPVLFAICKEPR